MYIVTSLHKEYLFEKFQIVIKVALNVESLNKFEARFFVNLSNWLGKAISNEILNSHFVEDKSNLLSRVLFRLYFKLF